MNTLQDLLQNIQGHIKVYEGFSKRKQKRRKYWEAFCSCVRMEMLLKDAIKKEDEQKNSQ